MRIILYLIVLIVSSYSNLAASSQLTEVEGTIKLVSELIVSNKWNLAKEKLESLDHKFNSDFKGLRYLAWSSWYGARDNPYFDMDASVNLIKEAAETGFWKANVLLIGIYIFSNDTKFINYSKGVELAKELFPYLLIKVSSTEEKNAQLHRTIGKFYIFGIGVDKNIKEGISYIRIAAELGDIEALSYFE